MLPQFKSLCCTAVDVVAEGMRAAGQAVTSAHFAAAQETVHIMTRLQLRVRMVLPEGYTKADALLHEMGQAALQTALAGIDATEAQQAQVLSAESLKLGESHHPITPGPAHHLQHWVCNAAIVGGSVAGDASIVHRLCWWAMKLIEPIC